MELTEVPTSIPDKGVSVEVAAAGVYHSDLHVLEGEVIPPPEGFILGHEVSGWVVEFSPRCENPHDLSPGGSCRCFVDNSLRQVLLMRQATGELLPIRRGEDAGLIGLNRGHAEYMTVPETPVFPIPKGVDVHTAADISCAYGTAYRALREAGTGPGTSLVIIGVGGVGLAAVELAGALSARPIVAVDVREPS